MSDPPPKLKHPTGWFAAGREVTRALELLSDGAFKLYVYVGLNADRRTGQLNMEHGGLAKAVRKSRRSVAAYLNELRQRGVFVIHPAVNQHLGGQIEICDAFWPYEKARASVKADTLGAYVEQTRRLLAARSCVGAAFTPADERLASSLFGRNVPIDDVEHAVLLGCARKYVTLINRQRCDSIMTFSYFENVIEEVRALKMPAEYWGHLQVRLARLEQQWIQMRAAAKSTTS
jgi:hypothetical protein